MYQYGKFTFATLGKTLGLERDFGRVTSNTTKKPVWVENAKNNTFFFLIVVFFLSSSTGVSGCITKLSALDNTQFCIVMAIDKRRERSSSVGSDSEIENDLDISVCLTWVYTQPD